MLNVNTLVYGWLRDVLNLSCLLSSPLSYFRIDNISVKKLNYNRFNYPFRTPPASQLQRLRSTVGGGNLNCVRALLYGAISETSLYAGLRCCLAMKAECGGEAQTHYTTLMRPPANLTSRRLPLPPPASSNKSGPYAIDPRN